jgi:hypothetical protein
MIILIPFLIKYQCFIILFLILENHYNKVFTRSILYERDERKTLLPLHGFHIEGLTKISSGLRVAFDMSRNLHIAKENSDG